MRHIRLVGDLANQNDDPDGWTANAAATQPGANSHYGSEEVDGGDNGDGDLYELNAQNGQHAVSANGAPGTGIGMGNPPRVQSYWFRDGRHSDGSNFLLGDGHVKWLRAIQVSPGFTIVDTTCGQARTPVAAARRPNCWRRGRCGCRC